MQILNEGQSVAGSGCIPKGGSANVHTTGPTLNIAASTSCGLGVSFGQNLPDGWSLRSTGAC